MLFKAELGAVCARACQIQGVWVDPSTAAGGSATLAPPRSSRRRCAPSPRRSACTSTTSTPPARRAYERVGLATPVPSPASCSECRTEPEPRVQVVCAADRRTARPPAAGRPLLASAASSADKPRRPTTPRRVPGHLVGGDVAARGRPHRRQRRRDGAAAAARHGPARTPTRVRRRSATVTTAGRRPRDRRRTRRVGSCPGSAPWRYDGHPTAGPPRRRRGVQWKPEPTRAPEADRGRPCPLTPARAAGAGRAAGRRRDTAVRQDRRGDRRRAADQVTDLPGLAAALRPATSSTAADIVTDVTKASPNAVRPGDHAAPAGLREGPGADPRPARHGVPGAPAAARAEPDVRPSRCSAGSAPATADVLKEVPAPPATLYAAADQLGRLRPAAGAEQERLTGTAGFRARDPSTIHRRVLTELQPGDQGPAARCRPRWYRSVQTAADTAVATDRGRPRWSRSDRHRRDPGGRSNNAQVHPSDALAGRFPAGSTLKILTSTALLQAKRGARPPRGRLPRHHGRRTARSSRTRTSSTSAGSPLREAFAHSCNTTFIRPGPALTRDALARRRRSTGWAPTGS